MTKGRHKKGDTNFKLVPNGIGCECIQQVFELPLWHPNVHQAYRVHKTPILHIILSQFNAIHTLTSCFLKFILILSSYTSSSSHTVIFISGFPTKILYEFLISPMRAACPILFDLSPYDIGDSLHPPLLFHLVQVQVLCMCCMSHCSIGRSLALFLLSVFLLTQTTCTFMPTF